jgi:hypothetical protein
VQKLVIYISNHASLMEQNEDEIKEEKHYSRG